MDLIYTRMLAYFKTSVKDFGKAEKVSYYVVNEKSRKLVV